MPYDSMKQSRWMHANKPEMAKKFDKEQQKAGGFGNLPEQKSEAMKRRLNKGGE